MKKRIATQFLYVVLLVFMASFMLFMICSVYPGTAESDQPILVQYANYMGGFFRGDLGESSIHPGVSVNELVFPVLWNGIKLYSGIIFLLGVVFVLIKKFRKIVFQEKYLAPFVVVSFLVMLLAMIIGEFRFGFPGVMKFYFEYDYNAVLGLTLISALAFIFANTINDIVALRQAK